jgi:hypothetical protein
MLRIGRLGRDDRVQRRQAAGGLVVRDDLLGLLHERVLGGIACGFPHLLVALAEDLDEELLLVGEVVHEARGSEPDALRDLAQRPAVEAGA